tara:strand:+ start:2671 stop:2898 length:228 start_codon:yes stop_codon:yes gene_type:complete
MVLSLYELAQNALDEAYRLRCECLLESVYENIPTPIEQNGTFQMVKKMKLCDSKTSDHTDKNHVSLTTDITVGES